MLNTTIKLSTKLNVVVFPQYVAFHNVHVSLRNKKNKLNRLYAFRPALLCTFLFIVFSVSRLCAQPDAPSNLYVISQDKSNELYWISSSSSGVTEYRIFRSEDSVSFTNIGAVLTPDTTYTDDGLTNGTFYFYRVTAFDGNESLPSNTDASTPQALLGRYLEFDGVDDYLVVDDSSDYMLQQNLSLEFWFRAEDTINIQYLLDRVSHASNTHPYNILLKDGKLTYRRAGDNTYYDISTINKDTWYHLAITRDAASAGTINFYLNGFLKLTITGTFSYSESYYSPCVLSIGSQSSSSGGSINYSAFFDGQIAELRMWDKTLTPTEITNNMNTRLKGDETDLLALFHLDDIYNTTVYNYTSVLRDAVAVGGPVSYDPQIKANNENMSIEEDETNHHFNIKANDSYGARSKIRTEIIEEPNHGTAKVVSNDSILFTPLLNYNGYDTIRYVLVDTTVFGVDPYIYSDTAFLYITVTPVNDPPIITSNGGGTTAYISIVENSDSVTTVTATDIDIPAQTISYSITAGTDQGLFVINNLTGKLSFKNAPDYENPTDSDNIYNVQIQAADNGTGSLTDFQNIEISVTNINEPVIITHAGGADSAFVNTKENIYNDSITTMTAFDPENSFGLYISGGPDKSRFTIDIARVLKMKYPSADFENPDDANGDGIFEVWVTASDGYTPNADTQKIFVQILDENDAPVITSHGGALVNMSLDENKTIVDTIYVKDEDIPSQTFTYSINHIVDHACFTINSISDTSAVLMFTTPPNHESPDDINSDNIYITQINVSDGDKNVTQAYIITISNINDKPNITSNGGGVNAVINVNENFYAVTTVTATDEDSPAQNLIFFISGGSDSSRFNIVPQTGVMTFKSIPNFEIPTDDNTDNMYNVTVSVSDGIDTTSQDIAVTIVDVDETGFFITTWETTTANEQITIPTNGNGYNYTINWGDGTEATAVAGDTAHIYPIPGIYTVSITGDFPTINFYNQGDNAKKILTVEQWGNIAWQSMGNAFVGCTNLRVPATDAPNLSNVEHLSSMFRGCTSFNDSIEHWDVSNIKNMSSMFKGDSSFNKPLNNWDVSGVTNMESMFENTSSFDQPLDNWDVSSVKNMYGMFRQTGSFNQDIGGWDVSNVTTMYTMFREARSFNQDISGWDMSNVTDISNMFYKASAFDQNLGKWQLNKDVKIPYNTFKGCGISCDNYSAALQEWASNPTITDSVKLSAADLTYGSHAIISRNKLISEKGWTISNDFLGKGTNDCTPANRPFVTVWDSDSTGISANNQITIPTNGTTGYKYYVHWEDVADNNSNGMLGPVYGDTTITFPAEGNYRITIIGDLPRIFFNNGGDKQKLQKVEQWGDNTWTSMEAAFLGCSNLRVAASDIPDLSNVTSMNQMFKGATTLNDLGNPNWDVSNVQDMSELFFNASNFNGNIGNWDVRNVQDMVGMFQGALSFNQPIGSWDVSNVQYMDSMFSGAQAFDQSIINWDVSNVQNMEYMFHKAQNFNQSINDWNLNSIGSQGINYIFLDANSFNQPLDKWITIVGTRITQLNSVFNGALSFNQPLESWDVSNVTSMDSLFADAQAFNQPLNGWDVSNVSSMNAMFRGAGSFNQYLGSWKSNSTQRAEMLDGTGIDCINFSATLNRWQNNTTVTNVILGAHGLEYGTNAADAVNELVNNRSWTINGVTASLSQCILFEIDDIVDTMVNENNVYTSVTPSIRGTPIGNIIYSISGGADSADFSINTTTGVVSMEDRDYEFPADENSDNIYEIEITITDDDGNTASENWKVTVADENESPTDISLSLTSVNENETIGTIVGYFTSTDEDSGDAHSYSLVTGTGDTDNSSFQISGNELLTSAIFDYESKKLYSVRIRTTNNGTGSLTYEKEFTIEVININDAPSGITLDNDHIDEGLPGNTYVGLFNTIDDDHSDNHTYDLVPGEGDTDNSRFMIAGTVLRTSEILKYNNQSTYSIRVRTTDNGDGNLTYEQAFTISLNKINNPPTGISITQSNINENEPEDTEVGVLTSIDLDDEDSYTYQILDGYDKDYFEITGNTLIASESFNFEIRDNYSIAIRTTDSGGRSFDSTFVIVVNDINDPPFFVNDDNISISFEGYSLEAYDSLSLCPKIFDEDGDATSYISMQVVNNNGLLKEDPSNTGCLIFVPDTSYRGIEEAVLVVSDNNTTALTDTLVFQFAITEPYINYPPVITDEFNSTVDTLYYVTFVNEAINICLNAYDLNGDVISVSGINIYEGAAETEMPGYSELCFDIWPATDFIGEVYASIILQDNGSPVLSDTVIMSLLVEPKLEFSQAISPNGDGIADYLHISGIEKFPDNNLTIFNRWGDIVYHQESYNNNDDIWNGQADGRAQGYVPDGTYFYLLEIEGYKKQIKGYLVLKRKSHE